MVELVDRCWPRLRQDLALLEGPISFSGARTWTLHDPVNNRFFRLGWLEYEIISLWNLGNIESIHAAIHQQTTLRPNTGHIGDFIKFLSVQQLLVVSTPEESHLLAMHAAQQRRIEPAHWLLHNYLFLRIPLIHPQAWLTRGLPWVRGFFSRKFLLLLSLGAVLGIYLISRQWENFAHAFMYAFTLEGALLTGLAIGTAKICHELGHAFAASRFGCRVPSMGIAFIVMWPVLWTDTTEAWKLRDKSARLTIDAAGMVAELALAVVASLLWQFLPDGPLRTGTYLLCATTWLMTIAVNCNPFMRFDGYYLLSDWLEIENLQERSFRLARWWLRRTLLGADSVPPEEWPSRMRLILLGYAFGTWIYRLILFFGIALLVYHYFFKLLGVFLMLVEIGWFIALPVSRELAQWLAMRKQLDWNRYNLASLAVLGTIIILICLPWQGTIKAPSILLAAQETALFATQGGRLGDARRDGESVKAGETVFRLSVPDLDDRIRLADAKVRGMEQKVRMQAVEQKLSRENWVDWQDLQTYRAELEGLKRKKEESEIKAPFDGILKDVPDDLNPGHTWIAKTEVLATLTSSDARRAIAYVQERDLPRIQVGRRAQYYPENAQHAPIDLKVVEIADTATKVLNYQEMASLYGGNLGVRLDADKKTVPEQSVYRVILEPDSSQPMPRLFYAEIGTVRMEAERTSVATELIRAIISIVIRESGW